MTLTFTTPAPDGRVHRAATASPSGRRPGPHRGFVLSVDLSGTPEQDPAEVLRVVAALAELAGEWFPSARTRAVVSAPGSPPRAVPTDRTATFRHRLEQTRTDPQVVLDVAHRTVTVAERQVELTAQETALLAHLARAGSRPIPRAELLEAVWRGHPLTSGTRTVDVHVRRLRAKTGLPDLVATVWGVGYRIDPRHPVQVRG
jgi:DNA-binding response OmpR family regulator